MAEREQGETPPPTGDDVRHADWAGEDLSELRHANVLFVDVDLGDTTGSGAVFDSCTFRDCLFNGARLTNVAFTNCTFVNCRFFDVELTGCKLVGSTFARCSFTAFVVEGGDWSFVGLPGADLRQAVFRDLRMREADLTGTRLGAAKLRSVDLSGAWLSRADLSGADLRGSDLSNLDPAETAIRGAIVDVQQAMTLAMALGVQVREEDS